MATIERSIDVDVAVGKAYSQWTRFQQFPSFMEGVKRVVVLDDGTLEWTAEIAGQERTWTAEIYEQEPDHVIAWRSTSGADNSGRVTFQELDLAKTRITLAMQWSPEGAVETAGDALGFDDRQVQRDLERFKEYIEAGGVETGIFRGEVAGGVTRGT
jgi:uncharacterized membrane protein